MREDLMTTFPDGGRSVYDGLVKARLVHAHGRSVLLPDLLVLPIGQEFLWYQPKFFSAPQLSFMDEGAYCQMSFELDEKTPLLIGFTKDRFLRNFGDGSQLFRCKVAGPPRLEELASGTCTVSADHAVTVDLFHHTSPGTVDAILWSGHFRASAWNIQGTRELLNVAYAYFTPLPAIRSDQDLRAIAMASDASIRLVPTNASSVGDCPEVKVYRESTWNRRAAIKVAIPSTILAPQHVYLKAPFREPVYYEICHPAIARVGVHPGHLIPFDGVRLLPVGDELKQFKYVVLGDADSEEGLMAPYDEESTKSVFLIDDCGGDTIFDGWRRQANSDQMTNRHFERVQLGSEK